MKNYFFTIVVTAYNNDKYISECLDSLLAQTYPNFEAIIIDDGSTDRTAEICKKYVEKDSRIRYYYQENSGATVGRVKAFSLAKGDYILGVDDDDTACNDLLETINNCLQAKDYDCVFYSFYLWENGKFTDV